MLNYKHTHAQLEAFTCSTESVHMLNENPHYVKESVHMFTRRFLSEYASRAPMPDKHRLCRTPIFALVDGVMNFRGASRGFNPHVSAL